MHYELSAEPVTRCTEYAGVIFRAAFPFSNPDAMKSRYVLRFVLFFAMVIGAGAQTEFLTAVDARVLVRITPAMRDSLAADARLISVQTTFVDHTSGAAPKWDYVFYSPTLVQMRTATVQRAADTFSVLISPATTQSTTLVAIDTSLAYAASNRMVEQLVRNDGYLDYRSRHFENPMESVRLDRFEEHQLTLPAGFPADHHLWHVEFERIGDSTMLCVVAPSTGASYCETFFDTTAERQVKTSVEGPNEYFVSNFGVFGQDVRREAPGFVYPRGSGLSYIYGSGFWFGARRAGGAKSVALSYDPNTNIGWMVPGDTKTSAPYASHADVYRSDDYDRSIGIIVGKPSELRWPLWHHVDSVVNTHVYYLSPRQYQMRDIDRTFGDQRPAFIDGTEEFVTRYRDDESGRMSPVGLQIEEHVFGAELGYLFRSVIVQYQIVNKSGANLSDCIVAGVTDFDIGDATNDVATFYNSRPDRRSAVCASRAETEPGYGSFAITLVESPVRGSNGFVDNTLRKSYQNQGRVTTFRSWKFEDDPGSTDDHYDFMSAGTIDQDSLYEDSRVLLASDPFDMAPGDTAWFAVAFTVFLQPYIGAGDIGFELDITRLFDEYYRTTLNAAPDEPSSRRTSGNIALDVYPNPASNSVRVVYDAIASGDARIDIIDPIGRVVASRALGESALGRHSQTIDVSTLAVGAYRLVVTARDGARTSTSLAITR